MTVGNFNGKPKSIALANSPYVQVDANGVFQTNNPVIEGDLVLIAVKNASNSASVIFNESEMLTYRNLLFLVSNVTVANAGDFLGLQISQDGGSSWVTTGYQASLRYGAYNSTSFSVQSSTSRLVVSGPLNTALNRCASTFTFYNYNSADYASISGNTVFANQASSNTVSFGLVGGIGSTGTSAIRFLASTGNISLGTFVCYGIKNS